MENASKALLMAGGVLIAVITIALLVRSFGVVSLFQKSQLTEEEQAQLIEFNEQYTRYLGQYVYGTEIISVINKSLDNKSYTITTKIKFANNGQGYSYNGYVYNTTTKRYDKSKVIIKKGDDLIITNDGNNNATVNSFINSLDNAGNLNTMAFKCTNIGYDSYGRVNSITFEEKA